jgi:hypothetical protein
LGLAHSMYASPYTAKRATTLKCGHRVEQGTIYYRFLSRMMGFNDYFTECTMCREREIAELRQRVSEVAAQ